MERILLEYGFKYIASNKLYRGDFEAIIWGNFVNITKYTPNRVRIVFTKNISSTKELDKTLKEYFHYSEIFF